LTKNEAISKINLLDTSKKLTSIDFQNEIDKFFREMLRQLGNIDNIVAIGHRIVHGGDKYIKTQEIGEEEILDLEKLNQFAPLHNHFNLAGIKASNKYLTDIKDYAVFDTAFFQDLPDVAKIYPIPYEYYEKHGIKKFGFHGISHKYAAQEACEKLKLDFKKMNLITVHLGGGCSASAISKGKPIDTSMGFTPLEGLMMMTRSGDVDFGAIKQIFINQLKLNQNRETVLEKVWEILNYDSGVKGIFGSNDFLELLKEVNFGNDRAKLAFEMFVNRIKKYIGAYIAILGKVDALVFTGEIGAGKSITRNKICDKMKILDGIKVIVIEPNEELAMAKDIKQIL